MADTALPTGSGMNRYGQSKLANILHAKTLHSQYGPGSASSQAGKGEIWTAVHPGIVESQLGRNAQLPAAMRKVIGVYGALGGRVNADFGSWTNLFCAASPEMTSNQSGTYFQRLAEPGWQSKMAKDMSLAKDLGEWTKREMAKGGWVN